MNEEIQVQEMYCDSIIPTKAFLFDAGFDLHAYVMCKQEIKPHTRVLIGTGIKIKIPKGYYGYTFSPYNFVEQGIDIVQKPNTEDEEFKLLLVNNSNNSVFIEKGDVISKIVMVKISLEDTVKVV